MSTDLNGFICNIQRVVPSFAGHPGHPEISRDTPDTCCERRHLRIILARGHRHALMLLLVTASQHVAQGLAVRVGIHVDAQDFELPVLKSPEFQIVHRDPLALCRRDFDIQGGHERMALNDDLRRASVVLDEVIEKVLIVRPQRGFAFDPCFAGHGSDQVRVVSKSRQQAFDIPVVRAFKVHPRGGFHLLFGRTPCHDLLLWGREPRY